MTMSRDELMEIIRKHKEWIEGKPSGERADLSGADLSGADLRRADLSDADLSGADYNESTAFYAMACPEKGAFVGFKKASGLIVELLIPEDAKRSSATTRKCRCSKAQVISITNPDGTDAGVPSIASSYRSGFVYTIGKMVEVDDFCEDRWAECAPGIHFFITRDEAVRY